MDKQEFFNDLPHVVHCECCRKPLPQVEWGIGPFGNSEWIGIGIAKCAKCNWLKIAAAGSDEMAFNEAHSMRLRLIYRIGLDVRA
jgi:hypothetical protein